MRGPSLTGLYPAAVARVASSSLMPPSGPTSNMIDFPYTYGEELTPLRSGEGLTGTIIQTGEPLLINEELARQTQELGATTIGRRARSYLGVPILVS